MAATERPLIFYLEDDVDTVEEHCRPLHRRYDVCPGADWGTIKAERARTVDLVILDIMIHERSRSGAGTTVENIRFEGASWIRAGLEFLRRLRQGAYEEHGFRRDVPVIVATARADREAIDEASRCGIEAYLIKPFAADVLEKAVNRVLSGTHPAQGN